MPRHSAFAPWSRAQVHVEWGTIGARHAADRGDIVVIVDVLSFSTEVVLAAAEDLTCLIYSDAELDAMGGIDTAAAILNARPHRRFGPRRLDDAPLLPHPHPPVPGERVLFRSTNGAAVTCAAEAAPELLIGSLANARACASHLGQLLAAATAERVTLIACGSDTATGGEHRFRPALEDWIAAGRIAAHLADRGLVLSPEAHSAACGWPGTKMLPACVAADALIQADLGETVTTAFAVDSTHAIPARLPSDPSRRVFTHAAT